MATYASGSTAIMGVSGVDMDFEDLIDKLYDIEATQANKLIQWREDWLLRREAFTEVRTALTEMQTALSAISTPEAFLAKTANSSDTTVVAASVSSDAVAGTYSIEVNQLATSSIWSISTGLSSKTDVVNETSSAGSFTYTYKGETRTLSVPAGTTLDGLKNIINNDAENLGVRVQLVQSGGEIVFQLSGLDTGADATLSVDATTNLTGLEVEQEAAWNYLSNANEVVSLVKYDSMTDAINTTETAKTFVFDLNGTEYSVKLAAGGSLTDLAAAINDLATKEGIAVTASIATFTYSGGEQDYSLHLEAGSTTDVLTVGGGTLEGYFSMIKTTNWDIQAGQNAEVRVNGWPASSWIECSSNSVSEVVDGITFNLRDEGKSTVTVELDIEGIEANVQSFVDAVNNFRTVILNLTKVDESKTVLDPEYAETQSEMQMGSSLTGNYGIQLLSSNLKQAISNQAKGFSYLETINGKDYGDVFSSLAQIGIITDSDESSATFGLLIINSATTSGGVTYQNSTSTLTLKEALEKDPEAVARLFAANNEAKSNSTYFGVNSIVEGITQPGTYDVSYTVDASGVITSATINGKAASIDNQNRQIALYSHDGSDDAAGVVLDIYDFTAGTKDGTFSVRQGKVNEILGMLSGTDGILGTNGTLAILENNYDTIIANIEDKIQKEDERLSKWLTTTKARFARLEATLANYMNLQTSIESQIESLNSSS
ncbi:MAG: hypothetical protein DELT_00108 [Desulfovibrio sp.]